MLNFFLSPLCAHVASPKSGVQRQQKGVPQGWFFLWSMLFFNPFTISFLNHSFVLATGILQPPGAPRKETQCRRPALPPSRPTCCLHTAMWTWCCNIGHSGVTLADAQGSAAQRGTTLLVVLATGRINLIQTLCLAHNPTATLAQCQEQEQEQEQKQKQEQEQLMHSEWQQELEKAAEHRWSTAEWGWRRRWRWSTRPQARATIGGQRRTGVIRGRGPSVGRLQHSE